MFWVLHHETRLRVKVRKLVQHVRANPSWGEFQRCLKELAAEVETIDQDGCKRGGLGGVKKEIAQVVAAFGEAVAVGEALLRALGAMQELVTDGTVDGEPAPQALQAAEWVLESSRSPKPNLEQLLLNLAFGPQLLTTSGEPRTPYTEPLLGDQREAPVALSELSGEALERIASAIDREDGTAEVACRDEFVAAGIEFQGPECVPQAVAHLSKERWRCVVHEVVCGVVPGGPAEQRELEAALAAAGKALLAWPGAVSEQPRELATAPESAPSESQVTGRAAQDSCQLRAQGQDQISVSKASLGGSPLPRSRGSSIVLPQAFGAISVVSLSPRPRFHVQAIVPLARVAAPGSTPASPSGKPSGVRALHRRHPGKPVRVCATAPQPSRPAEAVQLPVESTSVTPSLQKPGMPCPLSSPARITKQVSPPSASSRCSSTGPLPAIVHPQVGSSFSTLKPPRLLSLSPLPAARDLALSVPVPLPGRTLASVVGRQHRRKEDRRHPGATSPPPVRSQGKWRPPAATPRLQALLADGGKP